MGRSRVTSAFLYALLGLALSILIGGIAGTVLDLDLTQSSRLAGRIGFYVMVAFAVLGFIRGRRP